MNPLSSALTRRRLLGQASAGAFATLGLAACGSDDDPAPATGGGGESGAGSFPARVAHKFGITTVEAPPARVAAYGGGDVETLLALGVKPVLVPEMDPKWKDAGGVSPWARELLGEERPIIAGIAELEFERIASSRPDVITAVEFDMKRSDYEKLTELAPTVVPPKGFAPYTVPWDTMAVQVGAAIGRREDAQKLVDDAHQQIDDAAKANPSFEGAKLAAVSPDDNGGLYVFAPGDVRGRIFVDLGFELPDDLDGVFGKGFYAQLSAERFDLLDDADALVVISQSKPQADALRASRSWQRIKPVSEDRALWLEDHDTTWAMYFSTVLSIPRQLDAVVPKLADVLKA